MRDIRVLIIDDNTVLVNDIKKYFSSHENIKVVFDVSDGEKGIEIILKEQRRYDLIILDLIIPKRDGLAVLEELKKNNINKKIITLSSYYSEVIINDLSDYNISYYILKPFSLFDLEKRIMGCIDLNDFGLSTGQEKYIIDTLHELGVPSHIKGYYYIKDGILILYHRSKNNCEIKKDIYSDLAFKYNTTVANVERSIRHAIEISWNRGNWDFMLELFGHSISIDKAKPTNFQFITTITDKMRLEFRLS